MSDIDLIQPRHNYAPSIETGEQGHIYLPASLLSVASRMVGAGIDVKFHDENVGVAEIDSPIVGLNLVGPPYIPTVIDRINKIKEEDPSKRFLLGGKVIDGLTDYQFKRLFGEQVYNGNRPETLAEVLDVSYESIPDIGKVTLKDGLEILDDSQLNKYLSNEFPLWVSDGCRYHCNFCAAYRTRKDPQTGEWRVVAEEYRPEEMIRKDLEYLFTKAEHLGIPKLKTYLTNLDVFQTPEKLGRFSDIVHEIGSEHPDIKLKMRGLATEESYLQIEKKNPEIIDSLVKAGYYSTGFGVDGWGKDIWEKLEKQHNTEDRCIEAIRQSAERGITPEILMVFGHEKIDNEESLEAALNIVRKMQEEYGAIPRPHVAKGIAPGNDGWYDPENQEQVEKFIAHPEAFQALDYTALPSEITHGDSTLRALTTRYYLEMCDIPGNTTQFVLPIEPGMNPKEIQKVKTFNTGRYDR